MENWIRRSKMAIRFCSPLSYHVKRRPHEQVFTLTSFICSCGRKKWQHFLWRKCLLESWHSSSVNPWNSNHVPTELCRAGQRSLNCVLSFFCFLEPNLLQKAGVQTRAQHGGGLRNRWGDSPQSFGVEFILLQFFYIICLARRFIASPFLATKAAVTLELKKQAKQTESVYTKREWKLFSFHVTAVRACLFV